MRNTTVGLALCAGLLGCAGAPTMADIAAGTWVEQAPDLCVERALCERVTLIVELPRVRLNVRRSELGCGSPAIGAAGSFLVDAAWRIGDPSCGSSAPPAPGCMVSNLAAGICDWTARYRDGRFVLVLGQQRSQDEILLSPRLGAPAGRTLRFVRSAP